MEAWKQLNFNYQWLDRLRSARRDIISLIPEGESFILVNNDEWGKGEAVSGRQDIPFLERDGQYWGHPPNDDTAIHELDRLRASGAKFIVFWWTAFWWLDQYPTFHHYLRTKFTCILTSAHLIIFELGQEGMA
jgi:hypothetical protein